MQNVIHISISIDCPVSDAYTFASNPANLPRWAGGLARSEVTQIGDEWLADAPFGKVRIKFVRENTFGILDHEVSLESGETFYNPMRVMANGEGCECVFSLFRQTSMTDDAFNADKNAVESDLLKLKNILESQNI